MSQDFNANVDNLNPLSESTHIENPPVQEDGFELEVDPGKRERFTKDQLVQFYKGHLRQEDYTRKTQELAEQRRQIEQYGPYVEKMLTERQQIAEFLKNKELLQKYMKENFPEEKRQSEDELSRPVDFKTLQERESQREQTLQQQITHLQTQLQYAQQQGYQQMEQRIKDEIETAQHAEKISNHLSGLFSENPALSLIDNVEDILRFKVHNAKPKTLQEALSLFDKFAKEQTDRLAQHFTTVDTPAQQPKVAAKPKSIEPPGKGSPAPPPKKSYRNKDGKIDWDSIGEEALETYRAVTKEK